MSVETFIGEFLRLLIGPSLSVICAILVIKGKKIPKDSIPFRVIMIIMIALSTVIFTLRIITSYTEDESLFFLRYPLYIVITVAILWMIIRIINILYNYENEL